MLYQSPLCGQWARRTRYWPRQLSQAELIATTTLDGPTLSLDFMTPGALDPRIVFTRASTATYTDANGTIQTAAVNAPRWDYDPVTHALRGLLIEEARTNKLTNSGAPSAWGPVNIVQTNNAAVAPDGTTTAAKIADNVTNNQHAVNPAGPAITANTTNIFSVYLKAAGRPRALLYYASGSNSITATFDLTNGTMVGTPTLGGLASGAVWSITAVGNGWYRCAAGGLLDATSTAASTYVFIDNGTTSSYLGDGVSGLLVWGAQCEQGAFPTSYIPTTAATVTRAADVATMPTDVTKWYSTLNGTVLAEALLPPNGNVGYRGIFTLDGGPFNAWLRSYITGGTSNVDGNIDIASLGFGVMTPGTVFKCVATYSSAGSHCTLNGVMGVGSATVGTPSTWTTLRLGVTDGTNNNPANGYLRRLTYWNRALSDTEMQQVTT
jgi:hypothetical protein